MKPSTSLTAAVLFLVNNKSTSFTNNDILPRFLKKGSQHVINPLQVSLTPNDVLDEDKKYGKTYSYAEYPTKKAKAVVNDVDAPLMDTEKVNFDKTYTVRPYNAPKKYKVRPYTVISADNQFETPKVLDKVESKVADDLKELNDTPKVESISNSDAAAIQEVSEDVSEEVVSDSVEEQDDIEAAYGVIAESVTKKEDIEAAYGMIAKSVTEEEDNIMTESAEEIKVNVTDVSELDKVTASTEVEIHAKNDIKDETTPKVDVKNHEAIVEEKISPYPFFFAKEMQNGGTSESSTATISSTAEGSDDKVTATTKDIPKDKLSTEYPPKRYTFIRYSDYKR